jgi:hypothetical protein
MRTREADVDQLEETVKLVGGAKRRRSRTKPTNARGARSLEQDSLTPNRRRHRERSVAIHGRPPRTYDPLDRRVGPLLAMTLPSKRDVRYYALPCSRRESRPRVKL